MYDILRQAPNFGFAKLDWLPTSTMISNGEKWSVIRKTILRRTDQATTLRDRPAEWGCTDSYQISNAFEKLKIGLRSGKVGTRNHSTTQKMDYDLSR